jgi:hypothetical protein
MRSGLALSVAMLLAACTLGAFATDGGRPSATPAPTRPRPTSTPEVGSPRATPTPSPSQSPAPTPDPAAIELAATSCNGGVVLRWSPSSHPDFHHYVGLRSPERQIKPDYPPIAPAVDWGDLYATDRFVTSGFDATVVPSATTWHYRVMAYDGAGRVISRSEVASGRILPHRGLGRVRADVLGDGRVRLEWRRFDGVPECFTAYRVLQGTSGVAGTLLTTISDRSRTELETGALHAGATYAIRVQAVHTTTLGHFVLGESRTLTLVLPPEP